MSRASVLARGRAAALIGMTDACVITRSAGETNVGGGVVTEVTQQVYSGRCRIQVRSPSGTGQDVGEAYVIVQRIELQIPIAAPQLAEGDRVEMTAAAHDGQLVGKTYAVRDVLAKSEATSRRATLIEVTS